MIEKEIGYSIVVNKTKSRHGYGFRWYQELKFASDSAWWTIDHWPNGKAFILFRPSGGGLIERENLPVNWMFVHKK